MHEFSIAYSIKNIVYDNISQLENSEKIKVKSIKVKHGLLSQVVPDILLAAYESIIVDDPTLSGSKLELEVIPPLLECSACKKTFTSMDKNIIFMPCPHCNNVGSHKLLEGKELIVDHIEAEEN